MAKIAKASLKCREVSEKGCGKALNCKNRDKTLPAFDQTDSSAVS